MPKYRFFLVISGISGAMLNEMVLSFGERWVVANSACSPISHGLSLLRRGKTPTLPARLSSPVNTQTKYSITQIHKYSNNQLLKYSITQVLNYSSTHQLLKYPITQVPKYLDTQILKLNTKRIQSYQNNQ